MRFVSPLGLLGLLTVPLILLLHALRVRSKRVLVPGLHLWEFLDEQVRGQQFHRIPFTWPLVLQLLAAILASFALARPQFSISSVIQDQTHAIIILDTSTSMLAREQVSSSTTRFSQAQAEIQKVLQDLPPGGVITLMTFGQSRQWIGDTRDSTIPELIELLNDLQVGETASNPTNALLQAIGLGIPSLDDDLPNVIHVYTDGAFEEPKLFGLEVPVSWHIMGTPNPDNLAIIDLTVTQTSDSDPQAFFRLVNFSNQVVGTTVTMSVNGEKTDEYPVTLDAESSFPITWAVRSQDGTPPSSFEIGLSTTDVLPEDDHAFTGIQTTADLRVAVIGEETDRIKRAVEALTFVNLEQFTTENFPTSSRFDLIILQNQSINNLPAGNVLLFEPLAGDGLLSRVKSVSSNLTFSQSPILQELDFTGVRWTNAHVLDPLLLEGFTPLIRSEDVPILLHKSTPTGEAYIFTPELTTADDLPAPLVNHPIFPTLIGKIIQSTRTSPLPLSAASGETLALNPIGGRSVVLVTAPDGAAHIVTPDETTYANTLTPGLYTITLEDQNGIRQDHFLGVNAGSSNESSIDSQKWASETTAVELPIVENLEHIDLQPYLLWALVLILLAEAWLAWR